MTFSDLPEAELQAWLAPEAFDYAPVDERVAVVRLLARLETDLCPPGASLLVHRGPVSTSHPAFASTAEHRREGRRSAADELLWCASFAVPLEVIEFPHALFEVSAPGRLTLSLSLPDRRDSPPELAELGHTRVAAVPGKPSAHHPVVRRIAGLAVAIVVAGGATGAIHSAGAVIFPRSASSASPAVQATRPRVSFKPSLPVAPSPPQVPVNPLRHMSTGAVANHSSPPVAKPPLAAPAPPQASSGHAPAAASIATGSRASKHPAGSPRPASHSGARGHNSATTAHRRHPAPSQKRCATIGNWRHRSSKKATKPAPACRWTHRHPGSAGLKLPTGGAGLPQLSPVAPVKLPGGTHPAKAVTTPSPLGSVSGPAVATPWSSSLGFDPAAAAAFSQLSGLYANIPGPPAFLIPIYQHAGRRYHVPWQVLAAINSIETNYGRNLSVSTAGAIGWMQFMPGTWASYGVTADGRGAPNPYNPRDAIFSAGHYLAANGAARDLRGAIFAYNHAVWYVDEALWRAQMINDRPFFLPKHKHYKLPREARHMLAAAKSVLGGPYSGANHAGAFTQTPAEIRQLGTDCSGFVSYVLGQAGYLDAPQTTVTLPDQKKLKLGLGRYVTMWDLPLPGNSGHVIIDILGRWFESGGRVGGGIVEMTPAQASAEFSNAFEPLHPAGL